MLITITYSAIINYDIQRIKKFELWFGTEIFIKYLHFRMHSFISSDSNTDLSPTFINSNVYRIKIN